MSKIEIYTDGSCYPNPGGDGGWAFVVVEDGHIVHEGTGKGIETTNNRMEMMAVLSALEFTQEHMPNEDFTIYADSQYCVKGYNHWMHNWVKTNYKGRANSDLWKKLYELKGQKLAWVKGHADNVFNNRADELADYKR